MRDRPLSANLRPTFGDGNLRTPPIPSSLAEDATVDELAVAATTGDIEAVGRLYDELVSPIYRYIAMRVRSREDAEDLTHLV
ncbi:MAG: hypothetical protein ACR2GO_09735, partial [Candidatus Limnocylindria bacterium]